MNAFPVKTRPYLKETSEWCTFIKKTCLHLIVEGMRIVVSSLPEKKTRLVCGWVTLLKSRLQLKLQFDFFVKTVDH